MYSLLLDDVPTPTSSSCRPITIGSLSTSGIDSDALIDSCAAWDAAGISRPDICSDRILKSSNGSDERRVLYRTEQQQGDGASMNPAAAAVDCYSS